MVLVAKLRTFWANFNFQAMFYLQLVKLQHFTCICARLSWIWTKLLQFWASLASFSANLHLSKSCRDITIDKKTLEGDYNFIIWQNKYIEFHFIISHFLMFLSCMELKMLSYINKKLFIFGQVFLYITAFSTART